MIPSPAVISIANSSATSATIAASLPNDGTVFWYCSGFEITGGGATGGSMVIATLAGLLGGTLSYIFPVPAGVTVGATPLIVEFNPALVAVGVSTNVVLTLPALGAGSTAAAIVLHGYKGARQYNA